MGIGRTDEASLERKNMEKENNAGQQERPQADQHALSNAFHALYDPFLLFWKNADQAFKIASGNSRQFNCRNESEPASSAATHCLACNKIL